MITKLSAPTGSHAGEGVSDGAAWPGVMLLATGITAVPLCLSAAAYHFYGRALLAGVSALVLLLSGVLWLRIERKRLQRGTELPDNTGALG